MAAKRKTLGRGLDALLGTGSQPDSPPAAGSEGEFRRIPIELLQRGRYQPRQDMRPESLEELADSIRAQGVVQPIVVRAVGAAQGSGPGTFEIIAGERRWRAAQLAGLAEVPAIVREVDDEAAVAMALIENIQRENLNPLEEASALMRLIEEFSMTHQQAAEAVGRSRAAVSNLLRLLELSDEVKGMVERRELEMGHARSLLGLGQERQQVEVARLVHKKGLSVRETEALVRRLLEGKKPAETLAKQQKDPDVRKLENDLSERLGARVAIQYGTKGRGKLIVSYNSLDELEGILDHIK
jgi:ParB family chromosome partitioning protein